VIGYTAATEKRLTGFIIAGLATLAALVASLVSVVIDLLA
jgi:hypothetical protein